MTGISESNSATAVSESLQIGSGKQLFVGPWADDGRDDYLVESMRNVTMMANEAWVSGDRIIETDKPWELDPPGAGMNVIKEGETFRMYYQVDVPGEPQRGVICYAESTDGVHWIKPDLGLATWNGSRANNIILPVADSPAELANVGLVTFSGCPFVDPNAPAEQRYKAVIKTKGQVAAPSLGKGRYLVGSSDGIHWNLLSSKSVHRGDGDFSPLWDDRIGRYVAYERIKYLQVPAQIEHYTEKYGIEPEQIHWGARVLNEGRRISDDLFTWSDQVSVFAPDEIDDAFAPEGVTRIDAYGLNATRYDEAPAIYLGLPPMHSHWKCREIRGDRVLHLPSLIDVQLVTSRDGIHWHRSQGRKPFIRLGPQDSFWGGMVYPAGGKSDSSGRRVVVLLHRFSLQPPDPGHRRRSGPCHPETRRVHQRRCRVHQRRIAHPAAGLCRQQTATQHCYRGRWLCAHRDPGRSRQADRRLCRHQRTRRNYRQLHPRRGHLEGQYRRRRSGRPTHPPALYHAGLQALFLPVSALSCSARAARECREDHRTRRPADSLSRVPVPETMHGVSCNAI